MTLDHKLDYELCSCVYHFLSYLCRSLTNFNKTNDKRNHLWTSIHNLTETKCFIKTKMRQKQKKKQREGERQRKDSKLKNKNMCLPGNY